MIGRTRWRFNQVESTQNIAFELAAKGASHGTVVRADFQTAGRGRLGRSWVATPGSALMFSVVLRPELGPHELGPISIRIARVLSEVFIALGAQNVSIKWPNDVLIDGRKTCGILVQTRMMPELVAVVGIGINITESPETATNLSEAIGVPVDADVVYENILAGLDQMWSNQGAQLARAEIELIESRLWLNSESVSLQDADREIAGTILGIAPDGGLRLLTDESERVIHVGEITRGPRASYPQSSP